ncbi:HTTM domain-containing protein [Chryseobacterium oryctis]|uniref:HTTM domain-containing protein n=1 Tax=Chryseobacterium oryctis TaxID=2952618 RepID=A0ABT3HPU8_9FLAO|nr:HTTM domain-containing protein [Chryseobacterium oryctis]MCW3161653.1 HTTM domain-containing protein [Chryseobacterium oryctis]
MQNLLRKTRSLPYEFYQFFNEYKQEDKLFFAFFRISMGLFFLVHLLSIITDFDLLFTNNGLIPLEIIEFLGSDRMPSLHFVMKLFGLINVSEATVVIGYIVLYIIACISLTIGFMSRLSALIILILHILVFQSSSTFMYGIDFFKSIAMFYCVVFPLGRFYSVDNKIFKFKEVNPTPFRNLLRIHLSIVYFTSGLDKAFGINWWNGESIWKALHLPGFQSYILDNSSYEIFLNFPIIPIFIGISTIAVELLYPYFMWKNSTRKYFIWMVVALHAGIIIAMNLYFFGALMILLNLSAFLNLEESKKTVAVTS